MAVAYAFSKEEMAIDANLGYPRAYSKLCKDTSLGPYTNGPPFTFTPYILPPHEASRAEELDDILPIIDIEANPTAKTRTFVSILWKQLNHLGNAGFDPAMFRVDPYGNVVYFHADSASPLAWSIDHWFPCSRGGLTVPSNLRILQWQVCQRKHNQLEYLVPWWDLQLGISVNQFLSIFAAENSDFRQRAFRLLFQEGEHEELNDLQTVDSHNFPQAFIESKDQLGLTPATIVRNSKESSDPSSSTLTPLDINRQLRPSTPIIAAAKRLKNGVLKENEMPDMATIPTNPYQAIVMARDSLKQREKTNKMKTEIHRLDDEVNEFRLKNEEEMFTIQELEIELIKHKRKAEKCRKLAEAQSAHKAMLEKMISNAMHQSVVYKEQVRLNQAATNSLMARLEAQMSLSNSAEREVHRKFKQRDELEKQIGQEPEQARKRSRIENTDALVEEKEDKSLYLPRLKREGHLRKELREFLEEEQRLSKAALALIEEGNMEGIREEPLKLTLEPHIDEQNGERDSAMEEMTEMPKHLSKRVSFAHDREVEEDEESMKRKGKGNVEKWLQMLLEDTEGDDDLSPLKSTEQSGTFKSDEIIKILNERYPQKEIKVLRFPGSKLKTRGMDEIVEMEESEKCKESHGKEGVTFNSYRGQRSMSPRRRSISSEVDIIGNEGGKEKWENNGKDKGFERYERARLLRPFPSSPSKMRKGVDCSRKKPLVKDDANEYRDENQPLRHNILQSSMKTIKKVVKI